MSDAEQIFWVLTVLTFLLSLDWIPPGTVVFVASWGGRHKLRTLASHTLLGNARGGFVLGNVFPLRGSLLASPWPLCIAPQGVLAGSCSAPTEDGRGPQPRLGEFLPFEKIESAASDGFTVLVNERPFVVAFSKSAAADWAAALIELREMSRTARQKWIDRRLAASCDAGKAAEALRSALRNTRLLRFVASVAFAYAFGLLGMAAFTRWSPPFYYILAGYLPLAWGTFVCYARAAEQCRHSPRFKWLILLSPVDAFRAADGMLRQPMEEFHPLAASLAAASAAATNEFARRVALDLERPLPWPECKSADAEEARAWFASRLQFALAPLLAAISETTTSSTTAASADSLASPPQSLVEAWGYCPRCHDQFMRPAPSCSRCELPLQPFAASLASNTPHAGQNAVNGAAAKNSAISNG